MTQIEILQMLNVAIDADVDLDEDWTIYKYAGIDACSGCKVLFTHKPVLRQIYGNYIWGLKWYQLRIFGCRALQIGICTDDEDNKVLTKDMAKLYKLK